MKFVGSTMIYAYLQAIGIIYSHDKEVSYLNIIKINIESSLYLVFLLFLLIKI